MKKILITSALLMITAGCQPGSKSPDTGSKADTQKQILNAGVRTDDLGTVPSPDDEIKDSVSRQDAMKDLQLTVTKMAARLKMDVMGLGDATDESTKLLIEFVSRKKGEKQQDIVDALLSGNLNAALELKDLQGEISEKQMKKIAVQRSFEKITSAYGFDKEQTTTILAAIEKRDTMLNPSDDQLQFARDASENIKKKITALLNDYKSGNNSQLCGAVAIFATNFGNFLTMKSPIELPSFISRRAQATTTLLKIAETCKSDTTQARRDLGSELPKALIQVDAALQLVQLYIDPTTNNFAPISLEIMDRWKLNETPEVLHASGGALTGELAADGITCQVGDKVYGSAVVSSDEESSTAEVNFEVAGEKPFKIRKMQGQRGITLVYMSSKTNIVDAGKATSVNAGEGFVSAVLNLVPGFEPFAMTLGTSEAPISVVCQSK
ncbi:hypothetical protein ACLVWU_14405 [Bdellovibrio sp. HCB290]|uniref:hypothetical protein n=1 Tax=Bdellovibrio sp. HCB290 TaxID=3394356 RepID=UPI0039B5D028